MPGSSGLIYEVTLVIKREIAEPFDSWLANHIEEMLDIPGFLKAKVFALEDDEEGRARRVTQYFLESENHLEQYFAGQAEQMRQSGVDRFGDQFSASRRVLRQSDIAGGYVHEIEKCLNCGKALSGQYCGNCGQRARSRLISLWELLSDAFGDLFELDSRIWRTLVPLFLRPGKLTDEYLQGRRACFMPPFRTYIVLSILFFLVLLFNPKEDFSIFFEPEADVPEEERKDGKTSSEIRQEVLDELEAEGLIKPREQQPEEGASEPELTDEEDSDSSWDGVHVTIGDDDADGEDVETDEDCSLESMDELDLPEVLARRFTRERLQAVCQKVSADDGKALLDKLKENIPAALFFLLPLMALILKILYPLSKRYYVEHLLFVVHFHAFFFLMLILQMLFSRIGMMLSFNEDVVQLILVVTSLYVPVYLYKSMRRVYGQRHLATIPKYLALLISYFAGLLTIFAITGILAAFSI
jgi:hypothetical protein